MRQSQPETPAKCTDTQPRSVNRPPPALRARSQVNRPVVDWRSAESSVATKSATLRGRTVIVHSERFLPGADARLSGRSLPIWLAATPGHGCCRIRRCGTDSFDGVDGTNPVAGSTGPISGHWNWRPGLRPSANGVSTATQNLILILRSTAPTGYLANPLDALSQCGKTPAASTASVSATGRTRAGGIYQ